MVETGRLFARNGYSEPPLHEFDSASEALFSALVAFMDYQLNSSNSCSGGSEYPFLADAIKGL
jgi:hypothetical protein